MLFKLVIYISFVKLNCFLKMVYILLSLQGKELGTENVYSVLLVEALVLEVSRPGFFEARPNPGPPEFQCRRPPDLGPTIFMPDRTRVHPNFNFTNPPNLGPTIFIPARPEQDFFRAGPEMSGSRLISYWCHVNKITLQYNTMITLLHLYITRIKRSLSRKYPLTNVLFSDSS